MKIQILLSPFCATQVKYCPSIAIFAVESSVTITDHLRNANQSSDL